MAGWDKFSNEQYCYVTTVGRVTGKPHRIEIWFAIDGGVLYLMSGGRDRSDWVKNLRKTPEVTVEVGSGKFTGGARIIDDPEEDQRVRHVVHSKYAKAGWAGDLGEWRTTALPIAIESTESVS